MKNAGAPIDAVTQLASLPSLMSDLPRGDKGAGAPLLPDARISDATTSKTNTASVGSFVCPVDRCDVPVAGPGDPGYGSAR
jgi:hypothetical protein